MDTNEATMLAIGAAGAFDRAGLAFPLRNRWEDGQPFWQDDNIVRDAFNASDDEEAADKIRRRIKKAGLKRVSSLVFIRRLEEEQAGLRPQDDVFGWLYKIATLGILEYLVPPSAAGFFLDLESARQELAAQLIKLGFEDPRDRLAEIDRKIDLAVRKAGYTPKRRNR